MRSRSTRILIAAAVLSGLASGQYTTTIVAGGGPPNGTQATSMAIFRASGIAADGAGGFYFASGPQSKVFRVAANGTVTTVAGKGTSGFSGDNGPATSAQLSYPSGLALDSTGNLYIADTGNFRVRKISGGVISTVIGTGMPGFSGDGGLAFNAQISSASSVAVDTSGSLYVADGSRVRKVSGGIVTTVAGNGSYGFSGDGGPAINAQLNYVQAIAVDGLGNLYIADGNARIRRVTGGTITTIGGTGTTGYSGDGGPAISAEVSVLGMTADLAGNVYLSDGSLRIRRISGGMITRIAGNGIYGHSGDGGPALSASLAGPEALAVDTGGNLFIAENAAYYIRKVTSGVITTVAGNGFYGFSGDGGPATSAQLNAGDIAIDNAGALYIADNLDYRIRKVVGGAISTAVGNGSAGYAGDGGPAVSAQIGYSNMLATDGAGSLYISDRNSARLRKVTGGVITTIAGTGTFAYSGDGGPATSAQFGAIGPVAADSAGTVYVVDSDRVRKISGGTINLLAGRGPADGASATSISVGYHDVAVDSQGNVFIAAQSQHRIYKRAPNGTITAVAGTGSPGYSIENGTATNVSISGPSSIIVDAAGALYFVERGAFVRKVAGGLITTVAGFGTGCPQQTNSIGDGCPALNALLSSVSALAVDSAGSLYIAEISGRVRKVAGGIISTFAGTGTPGFSGDGGPAVNAQIGFWVQGLTADAAGNLYIADYENHRIRKVSSGVITTIAGTGTSGYAGDGGLPTNAQLMWPRSVAVDSAGNVYIADNSSRIRKIAGSMISTVVGIGVPGFAGDGSAATGAQISSDARVSVDSAGALYIPDGLNFRLRKVAAGIISTIAGNGFRSYSGDNGPAINAQIGSIRALAVDNTGTLYVSDSENGRVRAISSGGTISTFAGGGTQDGGLATSVRLAPAGVAVDGARNVYIADAATSMVRKVTSGVITSITPITTSAGLGSFPFPGDGSLAADTAGNLYISVAGSTVRKLTPTAQACTYSLTAAPTGLVSAAGGTVTLTVTTLAGCTWQMNSGAPWINAAGQTSGADSGSVTVNVQPNFGPARGATVSIGNQSVTINQVAYGCVYDASQAAFNVPANGQAITIALNASCSWTAQSSQTWAEVYPLSGPGSVPVIVNVYPNFGTQARTATVAVGTLTVAITQAGMPAETDLRFVRRAYFNALRRLPSNAEEQFHLTRLKSGVSRAAIMQNFLEGGEFKTGGAFVSGLYLILLGRNPERDGWAFQLNSVVVNRTPQSSLAGNFLNSAEWQLKQGGTITDPAFITLLYQQVLGRTPTPAEQTWQLGNLALSSRAQMATNFISGDEFFLNKGPRLNALHAFFVILGRNPTPAELTFRETQLRNGATFGSLIADFVNSAEHNDQLN